jgi:hypothetical protein
MITLESGLTEKIQEIIKKEKSLKDCLPEDILKHINAVSLSKDTSKIVVLLKGGVSYMYVTMRQAQIQSILKESGFNQPLTFKVGGF